MLASHRIKLSGDKLAFHLDLLKEIIKKKKVIEHELRHGILLWYLVEADVGKKRESETWIGKFSPDNERMGCGTFSEVKELAWDRAGGCKPVLLS